MATSMGRISAQTIDEYIANFPPEMQTLLSQIRQVISNAAPNAGEAIKYGMPTFTLHGNLVHFAACKNHIGFYPAPSGILAFAKEIAKFKSSKGAVQFPLDQPLPVQLITKIVKFRVKESKDNARIKELSNKYKNTTW
jgi:uncharacterized protein YdhG (YjbR/CyaY superfamily)